MSKRVGVVLSGCGYLDGAEIHESVLALISLDRRDAKVRCYAPNSDQMHVVNHLTGEPVPGERRNVLVESARIARGQVEDVAKARAADLDALVLPGGYGAAKNLSTFAVDGPGCRVDPDVERLVGEMLDARKPVGFICIAPAVAAKILEKRGVGGVQLTIGNDPGTAQALGSLGAKHVACTVGDIVVDADHRVVSTPAYMLAGRIREAAEGIDRLVARVLELA